MTDIVYLRCAAVMKMTGLTERTLYRYMSDGRFPRSFKLGPKTSGWKESEVKAWLASREETGAAA